MKALIIEDEHLAADRLAKLITSADPSIEVVGKIETVRNAVHWFQNRELPDVIFLDVQLADGLSFEIFKQVQISVPVIFTTSYDQYALKAFQVNSVDYLLKPIQEKDVRQAIKKLSSLKDQFSTLSFLDPEVIRKVYQAFAKKSYKERYIVKIGEHIKSISTEEILYFESKEKATFIKTRDQKSYIIDSTMDQVQEQLDPSGFFRINRKFIISLGSFDDIVSWSNSRLRICLKGNATMDAIVARERINEFKRWLDGDLFL